MDAEHPKQAWYKLAGTKTAEALKRRHFDAYYCETKAEALKKILSLIPQTDVVSWGGSITLAELGVQQKLAEMNYKVIDRATAKTPEEKTDITRKTLLCDTFLMSSNAITEDGQLFNIDGNGNRLGALIYGPKSVIVVAGMNKIVKTLDDAVNRVRTIAAPANRQRFPGETPCLLTGACADCISTDSICAQMVTTRLCKPTGRIKVILIGEELGL